MEYEGKSRRLRERLKLSLPVRVECRESADFRWIEMSRLMDVTPFGARFGLTHLTEQGRLLHLTLPMPRQLRCFDHVEPQYKIWAVVRNVQPHESKDARPQTAKTSGPRFEVGVAFVGKRPPASYEQDPSTRYDIQSLTPGECAYNLSEHQPPAFDPSHTERTTETRLLMPFDVLVEAFDEEGSPVLREQTVTENISRRGASVWTTLPLERGRFVRLTSLSQGLSLMAAVRARRAGADGITRLHLEFIDREWPLEGLE
jgi:hypothetical protein